MMYLLFGLFLFWMIFIAESKVAIVIGIALFVVNIVLIHRFMKKEDCDDV